MKILVLGGTRYFGKHIIDSLLRENHSVVIATRGNVLPEFSGNFQFVHADRTSLSDLKSLAELGPFDIIYDQICMNIEDALNAVEAFKTKCRRYVFTSTGSVYNFQNDHRLNEKDFDYQKYSLNLTRTTPPDYQEDKRQAEVVFGTQKHFPAVMVRLPIVLGMDDYTNRLKFHVEHIKKEMPFHIPRLETNLSFVHSEEAGEFFRFIGMSDYTGVINCASIGSVSLQSLVGMIEKETGKKAKIVSAEETKSFSPFGADKDFVMDTSLAQSLGFKFKELNEYLPKLITKMNLET